MPGKSPRTLMAIVHPPDVARRLIARVAGERGLHDG